MKSNIEESNINNDVSSPILFTQCQWSSRKRKHSNDELDLLNDKYEDNDVQATPKTSSLQQCQCVIHGEHTFCTPQRISSELPASDASKSCESATNRSIPKKNHWFFDTPSENIGSPYVRRHKGVSRRSLESLIDPELSISWMESMATPPSETSEKVAHISVCLSDHEEENVSPEIATSHRVQVESEMKTQTKRSVARVLFNQENIEQLAKDHTGAIDNWLFVENDGVAMIEDEDPRSHKKESACASVFGSDNEDRYTLSPCVVEAKMEKLKEENEEGGMVQLSFGKDVQETANLNTDDVCVGGNMDVSVNVNHLITTNECPGLLSYGCEGDRTFENQISASPPVVCNGIKKNLYAASGSTGDRSSKHRDKYRMMESDVCRVEERDLKRRSKRRNRKQSMGRVGGDDCNPTANHFMNEYKEEGYELQLHSANIVQPKSMPSRDQSVEFKGREGRAVTEKCNKFDTEVSISNSRADHLASCCLNRETCSRSMSNMICGYGKHALKSDSHRLCSNYSLCWPIEANVQDLCSQLSYKDGKPSQQLASNIGDEVILESTAPLEEDVLFSPVKVDTDGHSFACLPKKGSDTSETSDHGPPSPTVVGISKTDLVKGGIRSTKHLDKVTETAPKRMNSDPGTLSHEQPSRLTSSCATSKQESSLLSSFPNDILSNVGCPVGYDKAKCTGTSTAEYKKRNDDLQGAPLVDIIRQGPTKMLQRKSKESKQTIDRNDRNEWIFCDIIEEILHRTIALIEQMKPMKSFDKQQGREASYVSKALSPANIIPKTPRNQRLIKSSILKARRSINSEKLKRKLSDSQSFNLTLKNNDVRHNSVPAEKANLLGQPSMCKSDGALFKSAARNNSNANDLGFHDCKMVDRILHGISSECGSKNDSTDVHNISCDGEQNFQEANKGSKQFLVIHRKGTKLTNASYRDMENVASSEIDTATYCAQSNLETRNNFEGKNASQSLQIVGEQDSIDRVDGNKDFLPEKLNQKDYWHFSHTLDMKCQTQAPSKDLNKLMALEQEDDGNYACRVIVSPNKGKEMPQVDQPFDQNLSHSSKLGLHENEAGGPDISMDVLDDLMFGKSTLEASLLASVLTEETDSLADCCTLNQTPEQVVLKNSPVDNANGANSCSALINTASPCKLLKDVGWKEEEHFCSQAITVEDCGISSCKAKQETASERCKISPKSERGHLFEVVSSSENRNKCPECNHSVKHGKISVLSFGTPSSEMCGEERQNASIINRQVGSDGICCNSECNAMIKSGLSDEINDNRANAALQLPVTEKVKDIAITENFDEVDGINVSTSDSLLLSNHSILETNYERCADTRYESISLSSQNVESQSNQNEKTFITNLNVETVGGKEQSHSLDENNDVGLSQLLSSTLDLDESLQVCEERISADELQTQISKELLTFNEDGKLTPDDCLSISHSCLLNDVGNGETNKVPIMEYSGQTKRVMAEEQIGVGKTVDVSEIHACNRVNGSNNTNLFVSEWPMSKEQITFSSTELKSFNNLTYSETTAGCSNKIAETPTFTGFSTASGRKVAISEKSLDAARKKLNAVNENIVGTEKMSSFSGFSTASGKKVDISEKSLDAARKKLNAANEDIVGAEKMSSFSGFSTASGKKVDISEKSLDAARKKLNAANEDIVGAEKMSSFSGFSTASGRKVDISEKSLDAARTKLNAVNEDIIGAEKMSSFSGFSTASGRKVDISEKSLDAAGKKLNAANEDIVGAEKMSSFSGFSTASGKKVDISEKSLDAARKKLNAANEDIVGAEKMSSFSGFSTASGKKVDISEKSLDAARKKLNAANEDIVGAEKMSSFSGFSTASGRKVDISEKSLDAARTKLNAVNEDIIGAEKMSSFSGFSTASGRKVDISQKALDAARKKLNAVNEDVIGTEKMSSFSGFSTASGRKVDISETSLDAARKKLNAVNEDVIGAGKMSSFSGFSTASGRKVDISEKSLDAARTKLNAVNEDIIGAEKMSSLSGFSTASGRKVDISEKSLDAAGKKLNAANEDIIGAEKMSSFSGFSTASGRKVDISEKSLDAAKKKLNAVNEDIIGAEKMSSLSGFSTASGRKVDISEKALDAARTNLERIDQNMRKPEDLKLPAVVLTGNSPGCLCSMAEIEALPVGERAFMSDKCLPSEVFDGVLKKSHTTCGQLSNKMEDELFIEASTGLDENADEDNRLLRLDDAQPHPHSIHNATEMGFEPEDKYGAEFDDRLPCPGVNQAGTIVSFGKANFGRKGSSSFKGKSSNPSEYYHDREVKHTIPLIPRLSQFQDLKSPSMQRTCLTPVDDAKCPHIGSNSSAAPGYFRKSEMRITAPRSFSTPYRLKRTNEKEADSQTLRGSQLKRPLLASVPFGKKLRLGNEEEQLASERIRPQPGRLYRLKNLKKRPRLSQLVAGQQPACCSKKQLQDNGLEEAVISVCSENARDFLFSRDSFSDYALRKGETVVGDGAKLLLDKKGCAGLNEFQTAFISLPGVDKSLINDSWFANQYRWVVWKLASVEKSFPSLFAGRCLTPNEAMYHLKYRYDKEIDRAERSAIKKILERDDIATSRLVLCISRIISSEQPPKNNDFTADDGRKIDLHSNIVIEMTDGWYPIKAILDRPLSSLIQRRKLLLGQKLCIYGAKLIGSEQAVPPLEAPESLMLELSANSTRRAHWDAKLGFQANRRAFSVPIGSLFPDGGLVGCIDVVICRIYPQQWMEKLDSSCVFRNAAQEQRVSRKYDDEKHCKMEKIYQKIKQEYESSDSFSRGRCKSKRRSGVLTAKEISGVMNGHELNEILESAHDPGSMESMLSDHQRHMLAEFRGQEEEKRKCSIQKKFDKAWKEVQESFPERVVFPLQKFKIVDINCVSNKGAEAYLTVWKPTEDMMASWKEGQRVRIYNLKASPSRYKHCTSRVQLATMNSTRFELKSIDINRLSNVYHPREVTTFSTLKQLELQIVKEADVAGYVIFIGDQGSHGELQTVYLDDVSGVFLAVKIWGGLKAFYLEEIVKPRKVICFKNLLIKKDSFSCNTVTATYNDLSVALSNPKELYFQEATKYLKSQIEDISLYLNERTEALYDKVLSGNTGSRTSTVQKCSNLISPMALPISSNASTRSSTTSSVARSNGKRFPMTSENHKTPSACNSFLNEDMLLNPIELDDDTELHRERTKQLSLNRRKRQALARYGEPSDLSPLAAMITPKTRRGFKPPSKRKTT